MNNEIFILFTAGRGPIECALAVQGIQKKFGAYLLSQNISFEIVNQKSGEYRNSLETIVFNVKTPNHAVVNPWLGSLKWICQSPIRKYHKRRNWYIKCQEIDIHKDVEMCTKDVIVQTYKASGPGGQHRNKVETAIRIIHKSSGTIVTAADGKSQSQNKKKALAKLEALLEMQNNQMLRDINTDQWSSKLLIQRGNPAKTFVGRKFKES